MTYLEKLKDPRWQKKRLEVLQYYNFICDQCGDDKTELHVHHRAYIKGREPWDYPLEMFRSVCKPCHANLTQVDQALRGASDNAEIAVLIESIKAYLAEHASIEPGDETLFAAVEFIDFALGIICPPQLARFDLHLIPPTDAIRVIREKIEGLLRS